MEQLFYSGISSFSQCCQYRKKFWNIRIIKSGHLSIFLLVNYYCYTIVLFTVVTVGVC